MMETQTQLNGLTPPKWVAAQNEKGSRMYLEDRLTHFLEWLSLKHDVRLATWSPSGGIPLLPSETADLVRDYVNS